MTDMTLGDTTRNHSGKTPPKRPNVHIIHSYFIAAAENVRGGIQIKAIGRPLVTMH